MLELYMANSVGEYPQLFGANGPPNYWSLLGAAPVLGDFNGDYVVNHLDVNLFVQALTDRATYDAQDYGVDADLVGDVNADGAFNLGDVAAFKALINAAALSHAATVPEPSSTMPLILATIALCGKRRSLCGS